jgi:hypothetical protein
MHDALCFRRPFATSDFELRIAGINRRDLTKQQILPIAKHQQSLGRIYFLNKTGHLVTKGMCLLKTFGGNQS